MSDRLRTARAHASQLRFAGEQAAPDEIVRNPGQSSRNRSRGLRVSKQLTPRLYEVMDAVCQRLDVPRDGFVKTIVYPSAEMQARCSIESDNCLVEVTSALVERLNTGEVEFVIGHEIGHFLLDHHFIRMPPSNSIDYYRESRARELSADRFGLMACQNTDIAMRAIIKTFSGLPDTELRFDTVSFLQDAFLPDNHINLEADEADTHPTFAVRARCLVHFASVMDTIFRGGKEHEVMRMDAKVLKDFNTYSEAGVNRAANDMETNCASWIWVLAAVLSGKLSSAHSHEIGLRFGAEFIDKVRNIFSQMSPDEVRQFIDEKVQASVAQLRDKFPNSFADQVSNLIAECDEKLKTNLQTNHMQSILKVENG